MKGKKIQKQLNTIASRVSRLHIIDNCIELATNYPYEDSAPDKDDPMATYEFRDARFYIRCCTSESKPHFIEVFDTIKPGQLVNAKVLFEADRGCDRESSEEQDAKYLPDVDGWAITHYHPGTWEVKLKEILTSKKAEAKKKTQPAPLSREVEGDLVKALKERFGNLVG